MTSRVNGDGVTQLTAAEDVYESPSPQAIWARMVHVTRAPESLAGTIFDITNEAFSPDFQAFNWLTPLAAGPVVGC